MNPLRKTLIGAALVGSTLTGGALGAALINGTGVAGAESPAATSTTVAPATATPQAGTQQAPPPHDPSKGGHQANNITETLLTGDNATKATAAAQAAVDGGTVLRVENDAEGATYEAHVRKADGSEVTVKMDASFTVTGVEDGPGPGGHGPR